MNKKKLLIFIDWYYPAFKAGGPIKSVHNIANAFKEELDISIVTSAYDLNDEQPLKEVDLNKWVVPNGIRVIYLDNEHQKKANLKALIEDVGPDIVYFNSLFSKPFTLIPLAIAKKLKVEKIVVAPRGMLGQAALEIKPLKKRLFISLSRMLGLFRGVLWHASSELEKKEIQITFGKLIDVVIAQNIAGIATQRKLREDFKKVGHLKLIFFSRINEKKNLKFSIQVLNKIDNPNISLDIYGPIEDEEYWNECQQLMKNVNVYYAYKGLIHPSQLSKVLKEYHYLFFPTKHENYGHVITESLCASLPVIISNNTPWIDLEKENVGFDMPLEISSFANQIQLLLNEGQEDYIKRVSAAFDYSNKYIVHNNVVEQNRKLFNG